MTVSRNISECRVQLPPDRPSQRSVATWAPPLYKGGLGGYECVATGRAQEFGMTIGQRDEIHCRPSGLILIPPAPPYKGGELLSLRSINRQVANLNRFHAAGVAT